MHMSSLGPIGQFETAIIDARFGIEHFEGSNPHCNELPEQPIDYYLVVRDFPDYLFGPRTQVVEAVEELSTSDIAEIATTHVHHFAPNDRILALHALKKYSKAKTS